MIDFKSNNKCASWLRLFLEALAAADAPGRERIEIEG
jgi:hypothetical protein